MKRRDLRLILVPLFFLLVCVLWLVKIIPRPGDLLVWRGAEYSDILISHWPNAYFLRRSLQTWTQVPLWNPMILSGMPFAADPLSGLWYPPNWLAVVLPIQLAFNLLFWVHLAWAGWGMYCWMRSLGFGNAGALTAGLAWCGAPKWFAHIGLGHFGFVCAVSWTPWVLLLLRKALNAERSGERRWVRWSALTGVIFGLSFIADPRWAVPLALLCLAYAIHYTLTAESPEARIKASIRSLLTTGSISAIIAVGSAAVLLLPMGELVVNSTRSLLTIRDMTTLSMPYSRLVGILVPFFDQPEWLAYAGIGVLQLVLVALIAERTNARFWVGVVIASWLLALGDQFPLYPLLIRIVPGMKLLRVPPRFLFVAAFGLAILAGIGMDQIARARWRTKDLPAIHLASLALSALVVMFGVGLWLATQEGSGILLGVALVAVLAFLWVNISTQNRLQPRSLVIIWVLLIAADYSLVGFRALEVQPMTGKLSERSGVARLAAKLQGERTFSPSYSIPQQTAALFEIELADGVNPSQLRRYQEYLASAVGFSSREYSVSLPPFPTGGPGQARSLDLNMEKLGYLSVASIVSDFPIEADDAPLETVVDGVYIYRNEMVKPHAWMISEDAAIEPETIEISLWTPNRILLNATGPGRLFLSEVDYPGWYVEIDGIPGEIQRVYELLRSVDVPQGRHEVVFSFEPPLVRWGGFISVLTLFFIALLWVKR
jgi:hypothetical protein